VHTYVRDTEYAATKLIEAITHEERKLNSVNQERSVVQAAHDEAKRKRTSKESEASTKFQLFQNMDLNDDVDPLRAEWMFQQASRAKQEVTSLTREIDELASDIAGKQQEVDALAQSILNHTSSVEALATALLLIAQQGIAVVYGATTWKSFCPRGRQIGGVDLRDLVWQGRNQAAH
jgi:uncharacterized membrane protein